MANKFKRNNGRSGRRGTSNQEDSKSMGFEGKKKFCDDKVKSTSNDPNWYFKDSKILADVASFSYNQPLGNNLRFNQYHTPTSSDGNKISCASVPGIMAIRLGLTPGIAENAQSPVNLAATNVYSYVRYKNSGGSNYDAPDLMLYLLAMDSLYACWNWLQRIYGFASTYSQRNRYLPTAYMALNNVDFDDIMANLADFRGWLNIKANEISAFCVPATMTYNVRHSWLFSNIFKDSDTVKAQQYMYVPGWFYKYDETGSSEGGRLVTVEAVPADIAGATRYKVTDLMSILNTMIEAVNYSEDIGIMSGDILKAYGESGLFTIGTVDPDYKVEAVHSPEVLWQIENMHCVQLGNTAMSQFNIVQDPNTNFIKFGPVIDGVVAPRNGSYLNFHHMDVTPENVIVATRLICATTVDGKTQKTTITSCGSEIATNGYIAVFRPDGKFNAALEDNATLKLHVEEIPFVAYPKVSTTLADTVLNLDKYMAILGWYSAFDWAPELLLGSNYTISGTTYNDTVGVIRDWDNYTLLDNQDVESLNLLALLTEFNVPN